MMKEAAGRVKRWPGGGCATDRAGAQALGAARRRRRWKRAVATAARGGEKVATACRGAAAAAPAADDSREVWIAACVLNGSRQTRANVGTGNEKSHLHS